MFGFALGLLACTATAARLSRHRSRQMPQVLTPADGDEYMQALTTINRFCPVRCASEIVQPASTSELAAWLRANPTTPFTVKGGGHSYGCQSVPVDGGVMIHTGRLNDARVFKRPDGSAFLRAGPGLSFDQLVPRLEKMGYSMPHGECITVGMGGWNFNVGQHPELKNFDNSWGYDGQAYLTKVTFVDYDGTIFNVDRRGLHLVELGNSSWLRWQAKSALASTLAAAMWLGSVVTNRIDIVAVSNEMRLFKTYGASIAIATELEIELIPKPEPGFFQVSYSVNDVLDDAGGKGQQLMQALYDVVANAGTDPDLDCGIFYAAEWFRGTGEGAVFLKCVDWVSPNGDSIKRVAPSGYRDFGPKKSGFLFWTKDSYGKGWVPMWHAERIEDFEQAGGPEKYRDYLRTLEHGDAYGPNPCDSCSAELMFMLKPLRQAHIMFDNLCSARRSNQDACSAFVVRTKEAFQADRDIIYKQNLPSCAANPKWQSEVAEYGNGAYLIAQRLKDTWDGDRKVSFWLGVGSEANGGDCDAIRTQEVGATCQQHGIVPDDLVQAELAYVRGKCPAFESYGDFESQNTDCIDYIYNSSTPLPITFL